MHQYKIVATAYNEAGALTNSRIVVYKDTAEAAEAEYNRYKSALQENGMKAYSVQLLIAAYKPVDDAAKFFEQFHI